MKNYDEQMISNSGLVKKLKSIRSKKIVKSMGIKNNILELLTIFHEHLCFVLTANFVDHIDFYKFAKFLAFLELTWQVYKSLCSPRS